MTRFARRKDANHGSVLRTLQQAGCDVLDVAAVGDLGCDIVAWRGDRVRLIEVKDGAKSPSQCKLTDSEARLKLRHPRVWRMVSSEDEALAVAAELRGEGTHA